jgi:hypothetical protein
MRHEHYRGFDIWGHAIVRERGEEGADRFSASGSVTREGALVAASDVLDSTADENAAQDLGLDWARAWVDCHAGEAPTSVTGPRDGFH